MPLARVGLNKQADGGRSMGAPYQEGGRSIMRLYSRTTPIGNK